jgi:hypothetical protein
LLEKIFITSKIWPKLVGISIAKQKGKNNPLTERDGIKLMLLLGIF